MNEAKPNFNGNDATPWGNNPQQKHAIVKFSAYINVQGEENKINEIIKNPRRWVQKQLSSGVVIRANVEMRTQPKEITKKMVSGITDYTAGIEPKERDKRCFEIEKELENLRRRKNAGIY